MWVNINTTNSDSSSTPNTSHKQTLSTELLDLTSPSFLFGCTPPREGTTAIKSQESCSKFAARSAVLATDGLIVYDIQDEAGRTEISRPFPFRKTLDPSGYAALFPPLSGKSCVIYKCVVSESKEQFVEWLNEAVYKHQHDSFVLVGAPTSTPGEPYKGMSLAEGADVFEKFAEERKIKHPASPPIIFGCVAIAERHCERKGYKEHLNMVRKQNLGSEFFITQGIFTSAPVIKLINDYGELCRELGLIPKKVVLTFAPCGREKTMTFIKWLGMSVPVAVEERIFAKKSTVALAEGERDLGPVNESSKLSCEVFQEVLNGTIDSGVTFGVNVESLSIYKEEIDAAHTLFQSLQTQLLNFRGVKWSVKWYDVGKGGTAYDDVMIVEREREISEKKVIWFSGIAGAVGVLVGWGLARVMSARAAAAAGR